MLPVVAFNAGITNVIVVPAVFTDRTSPINWKGELWLYTRSPTLTDRSVVVVNEVSPIAMFPEDAIVPAVKFVNVDSTVGLLVEYTMSLR